MRRLVYFGVLFSWLALLLSACGADTTTLTPTDVLRSVRGRPLASAGVCSGRYSVSYSPAQGAVMVATGLIQPTTDRPGDA